MENNNHELSGSVIIFIMIWGGIWLFFLFLIMIMIPAKNPKQENFVAKNNEENEVTSLTFNDNTLFDKKNVKITIDGVEESSAFVQFTILVENKSKKDYGISAHSYAINGLMAGGTKMMSDVEVPSGKKGTFEILVDKEWLYDNGIDHIGRFDVMFWAYYENFKDWDTGVIKAKTNM